MIGAMRSASRTRVTGLLTGLAGLLLTPVLPATASAAEPTTLDLTATRVHAGATSSLTLTLRTTAGDPIAEAPLTLERRTSEGWRVVDEPVTDADGRAVVERTLVRDADANRFRASYDGDETWSGSTSGVVVAALRKRTGVLGLDGPTSVLDGRQVRLQVTWRTRAGEAVSGRVRVERRTGRRDWRPVTTLATGGQGKARLRVRPRVDTRWRVIAPGLDWVTRARSAVLRIDNRPPVTPVQLPPGAPKPRISLPPQPRGTGSGAHPVITPIPDGVWSSMVGRSWHAGCPVGRSGLRLLRINYWGYDGYRHRGELVASVGAVGAMSRALVGLYDAELPLRSLYRVDRFGWSARLQGADDYASMAAGNSSAFNCRQVVNRPGVRSPHSYGGSLDINPWENPYRSATGLVPNSWWASRSHPRVAWRSSAHPVVRVLAGSGFRWTYGTGDAQHFDAAGSGRVVPRERCGPVVCH
jgi:hypothetical protein